MHNAKDAAVLGVGLEDLLNVLLDRDVAMEEVDLAVGLVGGGRVGGESLERELRDAFDGGLVRVGEAVGVQRRVRKRMDY